MKQREGGGGRVRKRFVLHRVWTQDCGAGSARSVSAVVLLSSPGTRGHRSSQKRVAACGKGSVRAVGQRRGLIQEVRSLLSRWGCGRRRSPGTPRRAAPVAKAALGLRWQMLRRSGVRLVQDDGRESPQCGSDPLKSGGSAATVKMTKR